MCHLRALQYSARHPYCTASEILEDGQGIRGVTCMKARLKQFNPYIVQNIDFWSKFGITRVKRHPKIFRAWTLICCRKCLKDSHANAQARKRRLAFRADAKACLARAHVHDGELQLQHRSRLSSRARTCRPPTKKTVFATSQKGMRTQQHNITVCERNSGNAARTYLQIQRATKGWK